MRPSGTEDILRLYTEAQTAVDVERIANRIIVEVDSKYRVI